MVYVPFKTFEVMEHVYRTCVCTDRKFNIFEMRKNVNIIKMLLYYLEIQCTIIK
jgi:hypothetical protein